MTGSIEGSAGLRDLARRHPWQSEQGTSRTLSDLDSLVPLRSPVGTPGTYHTNSLMAVLCGYTDGERCTVAVVYPTDGSAFPKGLAYAYALRFDVDGSEIPAVDREFIPDDDMREV